MGRVLKQIGTRTIDATGRGVIVAVLDTGIDKSHQDLVDAIHPDSTDCDPRRGSLQDIEGHGTHISGIVAGRGRILRNRHGVATSCQILALNTFVKGEALSLALVLAAIDIAREAGADILNFSAEQRGERADGSELNPPWIWSGSSALYQAFSDAASQGLLCVVAAGNAGPALGSVSLPGGLPTLLTVGAMSRGSEIWDRSACGPFYLNEKEPNPTVESGDDWPAFERDR